MAACLMARFLAISASNAGAPNGTGGARVTVTPASGLGDVTTVVVSGTGFGSGAAVSVSQCSDQYLPHPIGGVHGRTCRGLASTVADQDGSFGPLSVVISRSFEGHDAFGNPRTDTCRPTNDCVVLAGSGDPPAGQGPPRLAWAELSFTG